MASYGHMLIIDISSLFSRLLLYITGMLQICYNYITIVYKFDTIQHNPNICSILLHKIYYI